MNLANPLALFGLLLAAAVVWLYRRPLRWRRETVAADYLWQQAMAVEPARLKWQPWRRKASLAVWCGVVVLTVFALAWPQAARPQRIVLIVDNAALGGSQAQPPLASNDGFANIKSLVAEVVAERNEADQITLLTAAPVAALCGPTSDSAALAAAVESLAPAEQPAAVADAVAVARTAIGAANDGRAVFVGRKPAVRGELGAWDISDVYRDERTFAEPAAVTDAIERAPRWAVGRTWPALWLFPAGLALGLATLGWCLEQRRWLE
jgi:hypothetical protein